MENLKEYIVPEKHSKNVKKIAKGDFTHIRCVKTGKVLPLEYFRIHKSGYYFSYCKKWEADQAKIRREKKKKKSGG